MNKKKLLIIILGVVLICAGAAAIWFSMDHTAPEVKPLEGLTFTDKDTITPQQLVIASDEDPELTYSSDLESLKLGEHVVGSFTANVTVADSSGNKTTCAVSFAVEPFDKIPPEISEFEDLIVEVDTDVDLAEGIEVTDNLDPAPTLVITPESIDTSEEAEHIITYTATDSYGNTTVKNRTVSVYKPAEPGSASVPTDYYTSTGPDWNRTGIPGQPFLVTVNRALCCVTVYKTDSDGNYTVPIKAMTCSVGQAGRSTAFESVTPLGFYITHYQAEWMPLYGGVVGRYVIGVTYDGIYFHSVPYYSYNVDDLEYEEYNKLGSPASLGCIRLCVADEKWLYDNLPYGFPVIIYEDETSPGPLGKPEPIRIDVNDERRGWDPTDPSPDNPWNN